jgi:hypothetical protein
MRHASRAAKSSGGTLIEVLISLVLLGIISSVVTLAVRRITPPDPTDPLTIIGDTINSVIASGRPLTLQFVVNGRAALATVSPDGSVIADTILHIERFTGRRRRAP